MHEYTKSEIKDMLNRSDVAVLRGLKRLMSFQTDDEQMCESTKEKNGVGFNSWDAEVLTPLGLRVERNNPISQKQINFVRNRIMKYAGQLARYANEQQGIFKSKVKK